MLKKYFNQDVETFLIDSCSSTSGWSANGGSVSLNTTIFKEGTSALNCVKTSISTSDFHVEKTQSAYNGTGKKINVWYYVKDTTTLNKLHSIEIFLFCPDVSNRVYQSLTKGSVGWNLVTVNIDSMAPTGSPNRTNIQNVRIDFNTNNNSDTFAAGDIIMDHWFLSETIIYKSTPTLKKMSSGLTNGLVSYYKMDETSGSTMVDSVGSNNGTISGATINQTGKIGKCYSFDGVNDNVRINLGSALTNYSISLWGRINNTSNNYWFMSGDGAGGNRFPDIVYENGGHKILFRGDDMDSGVRTNTSISTNTWYHVVITSTGTTKKIYLNGSDDTNTLASRTTVFNAALRFGERGDGTGDLNGLLDEIGIWNRVLSATEVTKLYNYSKARYFE
jgi:hypothetical protein